MGLRYVTEVERDATGDVVKLHNPLACWSPRGKASAIGDIMLALHEYCVVAADGSIHPIKLIREERALYLHAPYGVDTDSPPN